MLYNHTRNLNIGLTVIEEHLCDVMSKLNLSSSSDSKFILYSVLDDVEPEDRSRILDRINLMLHEIKQMKQDFALESETKYKRRNVIGHINGGLGSP